MACSLVYLTARDGDEARKIGRTLVKEKLAACVNYFPANSIFRWKGKTEEIHEVILLAKTTESLANKLISRAKELHSYEVPCIICFNPEKVEKRFSDWLQKELK